MNIIPSLPLQRRYPAGTIVQASDKQYVVERDGSWRVLKYEPPPPPPAQVQGKEAQPLEEPITPTQNENDLG